MMRWVSCRAVASAFVVTCWAPRLRKPTRETGSGWGSVSRSESASDVMSNVAETSSLDCDREVLGLLLPPRSDSSRPPTIVLVSQQWPRVCDQLRTPPTSCHLQIDSRGRPICEIVLEKSLYRLVERGKIYRAHRRLRTLRRGDLRVTSEKTLYSFSETHFRA